MIDPTDGNWTYTPAPNFYGSDSFTVTVTDDALLIPSSQLVASQSTVDDPSIISGDTSKFINEDSVVTGDLNATDPDGLNDGSLYIISTPPINGFATVDAIDGNWSYLPHPNFFGDDSFMVNVTDDLNNSSIQTIEINVHPVNDPTIIYGDLNATIYADITTRGKSPPRISTVCTQQLFLKSQTHPLQDLQP